MYSAHDVLGPHHYEGPFTIIMMGPKRVPGREAARTLRERCIGGASAVDPIHTEPVGGIPVMTEISKPTGAHKNAMDSRRLCGPGALAGLGEMVNDLGQHNNSPGTVWGNRQITLDGGNRISRLLLTLAVCGPHVR